MKGSSFSILILMIGVLLMIYASIDYFMVEGAFNYWVFFIGIIVLFLGIAVRSKNSGKEK